MYKLILLMFCIGIISSCSKDKNDLLVDYGEPYYGVYKGIQVYTDAQQMISDTTIQQIVLSKFVSDTTILVQIDVPSMSDPYYYIATETTFDHYGFCYHCPAITIEGDSLYGHWQPSLAPRRYQYWMKKQK